MKTRALFSRFPNILIMLSVRPRVDVLDLLLRHNILIMDEGRGLKVGRFYVIIGI